MMRFKNFFFHISVRTNSTDVQKGEVYMFNTTFEDLKKLPVEEQVQKLNDAICQLSSMGIKPKGSRRFAKISGLGVCFSEIERHLRAYNYVFDGTAFIPLEECEGKPVSKKQDKDMRMVIMDSCQANQKVVKKSVLMYPGTWEQIEKLCETADWFAMTLLF